MLSTSKSFFRNPSGGAAPTTDASFAYVPLLTETGSTSSRSTTVADGAQTPNTVTRNGAVPTGWTSPYQTDGYWSNYFNGSSQLSLSNNADFEIGAGNFSYEAFVYATVATNTFAQGIVSYGIAGSTGSSTCDMAISAAGFFQLAYATGAAATLTDSTAFPLNQWVHCVVCRSGTTISMFVNGVRRATATTSATVGTGGIMTIGSQWYANASTRQLQNGYISNARVLKGASAYDATLTTLTVPTAPLSPSTANQVLLTCYSNRFIDANTATIAKTITPSGTPSVQSGYYPFAAPTASPGAGLFNGTSQYLSVPSNAAFGFGTGDYTIEGWVYLPNSATGSTQDLVDIRPTSGASPIAVGVNPTGFPFAYNGTTYISSIAASSSAWNHIAVVRSGSGTNNCKIYLNGVQGAQFTDTSNYGTSNPCVIGRNVSSAVDYLNGYIGNFRLVKGTAVYTGAFTPPSGPLTQTGGTYPSTTNVNTSIPAANTTLLLALSDSNYTSASSGGTNNSFIDSSTNAFTITRNGTPTQGSFTPYWPNGQWSNYFNGSSTLNLATNAIPASGAFTFETFVYVTGTAASQVITAQYPNGTATGRLMILWNDTANKFTVVLGASTVFVSDATYSANSWLYLVIQRDASNVWSMYVNGTRNTATVTSATAIDTAATYIGNRNTGGTPYTGYISNLRVVSSALYSGSTISVPTTPFSVSTTNQVLLTCYSNRFIDANTATTAKVITVTGTPTVQAFQPFSPAASYSAATYAGSGYFNGSTDYLTTPANAAFTFGTGDLTLECWIYQTATSTSAYKVIFTDNVYAAAGGYALYSYNNALNLWRGGAEIIAPAGTINLNAWTHVAWTRSGSSNRLFINGTQVGATTTNANSYTGTITYIGASSVPTLFFPGYISNARIVKGTAVYTADFTPPATPVTNITNTSLLLNMANAGIYDAAAQNDITTVGDAQVSTAQYQWSPSSMKFDGTGDYLTTPLTPATTITSGNFTIEFWLNPSTVATATQAIIGTSEGVTAGTINWLVYLVTSALSFQCYSNASVLMVSFSHQTTLSAGTWYYCALTRNGSTFTLYINGVASTSTPTSAATINQSGTTLYVGKFGASSTISALNGYLQDVRMTKGVARTITTPTAAFPTR